MAKLNKNNLGLCLGILMALVHLIWAVMVWAGVAKISIDWVLSLHFISMSYNITPVNLVSAVLLIILTFVCGYIGGWVFAYVWNLVNKLK